MSMKPTTVSRLTNRIRITSDRAAEQVLAFHWRDADEPMPSRATHQQVVAKQCRSLGLTRDRGYRSCSDDFSRSGGIGPAAMIFLAQARSIAADVIGATPSSSNRSPVPRRRGGYRSCSDNFCCREFTGLKSMKSDGGLTTPIVLDRSPVSSPGSGGIGDASPRFKS